MSRIRTLTVSEEHFARPEWFDLAGYWAASTIDYETRPGRIQVQARLDPDAIDAPAYVIEPAAMRAAQAAASRPDDQGRITVTIPFDSIAEAHADLVRLGGKIEVLQPAELRQRLAETGEELVAKYRDSARA